MKHSKRFRLTALLWALLALPFWANAQNIPVSGTVIDENGEPLIGATVQQKGTSVGTATDIDGKFILNVPGKSTLIFSYVGYDTQEIKVEGRSKINVSLKPNSDMLDEVVVVGYGQMRKSDMTGSVASVTSDAIQKSVPTSIDQVLQGRAAGVTIQANSGTPGASSTIRIRGINSLNASSQPIFVIDGVVIEASGDDDNGNSNPLATINPSDIVTMDILKDASATAIYGSRASNGVIMITTKRGAKGHASVSYDGYVGWQEMAKKYDMLNLKEYAAHHNYRASLGVTPQSNNYVRPDMLGEGTDWQDELFRTAFMTSHNISVSGGNELTTYAFSGGYLDQDGIALGSDFRRLSLRSNIDSQIKSWLKGGVSFSFSETKQDVGTEGNILTALMQQPVVAVTSPDGTFDGPEDSWMPDNPVGLASLITNKNKKTNFRLNAYLEATLYKGLTLRTEVSGDWNYNNYYFYQPDYQFGVKKQEIRSSRWTKVNTKYWSWRNILTYANIFNDVHSINVMLGQEMSHFNWEQQVGTASGFLTNTTPDLSAGDSNTSRSTGSKFDNSILSWFGRAFYSYDDKYLVTATIRRDGSSRFTQKNRWGWFPSVALAWRLSNEKFLSGLDWLNNAKLRLGWGSTGNQNVDQWATIGLLNFKTTPWGQGVMNANTPNSDLKWETTYSYNLGLDLGFLSNRIEFSADLYYKRTKNLLLQVQMPAYINGYGSDGPANPWQNIGSLENKGVEFTLNTTNITNRDFQWTTNVVFSLNRNKVRELDTESATLVRTMQPGSTNMNITMTKVGEPVAQFWGYKVIGRFDKPTDFYRHDENGNLVQVAIPKGNTISPSSTWIGDYIFEDVNEDGVIDEKDCTFIGNPEPKFTFGFGNTLTWKGFDLNIFFSGSYGNKALNLTRMRVEDPRVNSNVTKDAANVPIIEKYDPNGPDNDYRNLYVSNASSTLMSAVQQSDANNNYTRISDRLVEDASYIRLQNLSLGYTFPKAWMHKIYLENLRIYCTFQNLFTITKYKGLDPEVGAHNGDALLNGVDYGRYPSPRIYTVGLNLTF